MVTLNWIVWSFKNIQSKCSWPAVKKFNCTKSFVENVKGGNNIPQFVEIGVAVKLLCKLGISLCMIWFSSFWLVCNKSSLSSSSFSLSISPECDCLLPPTIKGENSSSLVRLHDIWCVLICWIISFTSSSVVQSYKPILRAFPPIVLADTAANISGCTSFISAQQCFKALFFKCTTQF